jgi:hypothetical protein
MYQGQDSSNPILSDSLSSDITNTYCYPFLDIIDNISENAEINEYMKEPFAENKAAGSIRIKEFLKPGWEEEIYRIKIKCLYYLIHIFDSNLKTLKSYTKELQVGRLARV